MRIDLRKSAPENIYVKTCPASFPGARIASFLPSTLNFFRECWRSAGVAAHDLILVEVSGKCCWQVPICGDMLMICLCYKTVLPSTLHSISCLRAVSSFCNTFSYPFPPGWVLYVCRSVTLIQWNGAILSSQTSTGSVAILFLEHLCVPYLIHLRVSC